MPHPQFVNPGSPLTVSFGVAHNELETSIAILKKWQERLALLMDQPEGPRTGLDAREEQEFEYTPWGKELQAELRVVAGKCEVLAEAIDTSAMD